MTSEWKERVRVPWDLEAGGMHIPLEYWFNLPMHRIDRALLLPRIEALVDKFLRDRIESMRSEELSSLIFGYLSGAELFLFYQIYSWRRRMQEGIE